MYEVSQSKNMDRSETVRNALLALLRGCLWERRVEPLSLFPLSHTSWEELYRLARQQTVTGVTFRGLYYLPEDMLPPEPLLMRWTAETDAIERRNRKMNRALTSLLSLMAQNGLHPVLQKGQGLAALYTNPFLRECGDIDLFFPGPGEFEAASRCVEKQDIRMVRKADGCLLYSWQGIPVEHHIRLLDLYHPHHRIKKTKQIWEFRRMPLSAASDLEVTVPAPSLNLLLQYAHILKHALGRGIGLRQLCDLALSCDRWHTAIMPDVLQGVCRQAGLTKWVPLLHAFLTERLRLAPTGFLIRKQPPVHSHCLKLYGGEEILGIKPTGLPGQLCYTKYRQPRHSGAISVLRSDTHPRRLLPFS